MSAVGELEAFVLDSMRSSQDRDLARRAFSHELGREPTADQLDKFTTSLARRVPADDGEPFFDAADVYRNAARRSFISSQSSQPNDNQLSGIATRFARSC